MTECEKGRVTEKMSNEPLEPQFWQPARLIEGFNLEHAKENPCSRTKEAIQIEVLFVGKNLVSFSFLQVLLLTL